MRLLSSPLANVGSKGFKQNTFDSSLDGRQFPEERPPFVAALLLEVEDNIGGECYLGASRSVVKRLVIGKVVSEFRPEGRRRTQPVTVS